ncbi:response regulator [Leptospira sp. GIMC2001]|uniref:response regulator n=1 Tax=Leptospira sp. GIMC2001 TaxID=1513297 RepID=UPI0023493FFE|nr:response regulator [Leptospira sp. GIMC2001]WCL50196.1 response regulator [Leptospira sp. GIMC2001]
MNSIHVLLVEDNDGDILLTKEALLEGKFSNEVTVIKDGWKAIQYLEEVDLDGNLKNQIPDLILLDVNLPKMNGHEVLNRIKANHKIKHIPVIMLTTSSLDADINLSYRSYVNCYITKPIDVNDYVSIVHKIQNFWISAVQLPRLKME